MPKHVVLGKEHEHHHREEVMVEGLVVVLIIVHAVAFLFWTYLLYRTRDRKGPARPGSPARAAPRPSTAGAAPGGAAPKPASPAKGIFTWRTPREILAQQKAKLGKV